MSSTSRNISLGQTFAIAYAALILLPVNFFLNSSAAIAEQKVELPNSELHELIHQFYEARVESDAKNMEAQRQKAKNPDSPYWKQVRENNSYDRATGTMRYWMDKDDWQEYSGEQIKSSRCVAINGETIECQILTKGKKQIKDPYAELPFFNDLEHRYSFRIKKEGVGHKLIAYQFHLFKGWCQLIATSQADCDG